MPAGPRSMNFQGVIDSLEVDGSTSRHVELPTDHLQALVMAGIGVELRKIANQLKRIADVQDPPTP